MAKRRTKADLEAEIVKVSAQSDENYKNGREWKALADEREKKITEVRGQFADLKKRLHEAEVENARLSGYMTRVHEGDIARDGHVEITEGNEKRSVPRWPSQPDTIRYEETSFDQYGKRQPRKHWTEY